MKQCYITITGLKHYYGQKPFRPGQSVRLVKEPGNPYDCEAIRVEMPVIGTVGYVANSSDTVFQGSFSAGRLYDKIGKETTAVVCLLTHSSVVAKVRLEKAPSHRQPFPVSVRAIGIDDIAF